MARNVCLLLLATGLTNRQESTTMSKNKVEDTFSRRFKIVPNDPRDLSGLNGPGLVKTPATKTLSTTLSKLYQQRHAANSCRGLPRYFDDLFIVTTSGGMLGEERSRSGNGFCSVSRTICLQFVFSDKRNYVYEQAGRSRMNGDIFLSEKKNNTSNSSIVV